ncbi:Myb-like DNA-binding domain containing protein [Trichomonas vaginalis G3]|uniref:Myb-like DNA-binding domain containing protein n=1 Tax=Trichomonas vaginalis (strain ATCC PRA-98 / G3) TaxID=412133 RepID=A2FD18_TRIV3|nr:RNA polymerase II transcription regulator recruiting protein [Trichomonas vaginalis G3]EAX97211.1 Myb-like DNA-binding domain containing protein [Trichomonas vaginalis G3]KAI5536200.1 RNA polymerase II transcription regulator recruiting protein [Trichomonas vaginalis G3]|eukprot:XP_001310141.1 Myb-like DNA-binding domain containing protein [Trichomonas vaginalis G3]
MSHTCNHPIVKRKWSPEEDRILMKQIKETGPLMWDQIARHIPGRSGKQCKERWITVLDPNINRQDWSAEEDSRLLKFHKMYGNKWATISSHMKGRSSISVKNRFKFLKRHSARRIRTFGYDPLEQQETQESPAPEICFEMIELPAHMRIRLF